MIEPSIWELESFYAPKDLVIIGSGLAGLWSAYYIKKKFPAYDIMVVDKSPVPTGASTRNAGFACYGSLTELLYDAEETSDQHMLDIVKLRYEGLKRIRHILSKKEIEWEKNGGYELIPPGRFASKKELKKQVSRFNHLLTRITGKKNVFQL